MEERVIRDLEDRDCATLASLYVEYFEPSVVTAFGQGFLRSAYEGMKGARHGRTIILVDDGETRGFATLVFDEGRFIREILKKRGLKMALQALGAMLKNPGLLRNVVRAMRYPRIYAHLTKAELLTLIAREGHRGEGTGTMLLEEAVRIFRREGIRTFKVSVKKDWSRAISFYLKRGFKPLGEIEDGRAGMLFLTYDTRQDVRREP